jgi:hypothetical protein
MPSSITAAAKQRAYRDRRRSGRVVLRIEIDEVALVETLIAAGYLPREQDDDRAAVQAALTSMLEIWCVTSNATA